jgi:membrane complex biogenesis BtpA family protein
VIGMLHAPALPGSPANALTFDEIRRWVLADAEALVSGGVHALMLENFGDVPFYPSRVPAHTVAFLAVLAAEVKSRFALPLGINVLRNDGTSAIAVATATGAAFVRVNVYTGARLTDQGIIQGAAHRLLRYRKLLGSGVLVLADVAVKRSAPLAARTLEEEVEETVGRGLADGIIVSGAGTGKETRPDDLRAAKAAAGAAPVFAGSGADPDNLRPLFAHADGIIAGTALKRGGRTTSPVDPARVKAFMAATRLAPLL